ncbi:MAG: toxin-antitoxin system HicB family antitoxin [Negativicutes bacterium]
MRGGKGVLLLLYHNYLEACTRLSNSPDKEYKGSFNLCFPRELSRRQACLSSPAQEQNQAA